jgi:hypothetical protein
MANNITLISSPITSSIDSPPPPSEPQNLNNFFPGKFQFFYYMRDTYNYLNKTTELEISLPRNEID